MRTRRTLLRRGLVLATALLLFTGIGGCVGDGPVVQHPIKPPHTTRPALYEVRRGPMPTSPLVAAVFVIPGQPQYGQECCSSAMMPILPDDQWIAVGDAPPAMGWCMEYGSQLVDPFTADWAGDPNVTSNVVPCTQQ